MPARSTTTHLRTLDGLRLEGTVVTPEAAVDSAALLVHGGGVTREEGGFFARLAEGLADAGIASLRYDLRGHGASEGRPEESSLAAHLNDIRVARQHLAQATGAAGTSLIGASFGGGLTAYYAASCPDEVAGWCC